jgi:hypothetical protein
MGMIRWGDATPEVFSEEERGLVLAALERFGWLNNPCLVCGKESFVVLQGFVMPALHKNLHTAPYANAASLVIVCDGCADTRLVNGNVLGLRHLIEPAT